MFLQKVKGAVRETRKVVRPNRYLGQKGRKNSTAKVGDFIMGSVGHLLSTGTAVDFKHFAKTLFRSSKSTNFIHQLFKK